MKMIFAPKCKPFITQNVQVTLPTCMLMFLSQMINTFTDQYVTMVVQVNLTVMLVLSTL